MSDKRGKHKTGILGFGCVRQEEVQVLGTIRRSDLLRHQQELEALGAFIVQVPDALPVEQLV